MSRLVPPDFAAARPAGAPDATFVRAPADGVRPEGFFTTTNLPTHERVTGRGGLPRAPRMDSALGLEPDGSLREMPTICVDSSESVVSKPRGGRTHQAFGVVTNAQDFMHILRRYVERELAERAAVAPGTQPAAGVAR